MWQVDSMVSLLGPSIVPQQQKLKAEATSVINHDYNFHSAAYKDMDVTLAGMHKFIVKFINPLF